MRTNVEFKARCDDLEAARLSCQQLGGSLLRSDDQKDSYFGVLRGRLKLRENSEGANLIYYSRLDAPLPRESSFEIVPVRDDSWPLLNLFWRAIGAPVTIKKWRETYKIGPALINIDQVSGLGDFIEIEVDVDQAGSVNAATRYAETLQQAFGLSPGDFVPWSYAELHVMYESAKEWRKKLGERPPIFLLDGASCTGKTTLATRITEQSDLNAELIPRYSTRQPRGDRGTEPEYVFVTQDEFRALAMKGEFIEYRDFRFGMSYGLPWRQTAEIVARGRNALGIIDLGNVRHVKAVLPDARTILVTASEETLRRRLRARGYNADHEIEERLENARKVVFYTEFYDYVVENGEGMLEQAEERISQIVRESGR